MQRHAILRVRGRQAGLCPKTYDDPLPVYALLDERLVAADDNSAGLQDGCYLPSCKKPARSKSARSTAACRTTPMPRSLSSRRALANLAFHNRPFCELRRRLRGRIRTCDSCVPNAVHIFQVVDFSCCDARFRHALFTVVSPNSLRFRCGVLKQNGPAFFCDQAD